MNKLKMIKQTNHRGSRSTKYSWDLDQPPQHPAAPPTRYFFQGESLARGLELALSRRDALVSGGKDKAFAAAEWRSVSGVAISENNYAIEVALDLHTAAKRGARLRIVVGRNDQELGQMVKAEARNLAALAPRLLRNIAPPISSGTLFLPDRHRRTGQNRRIPAYATRPLPESVYCGIGRSGQLVAYAASPRLLSLDATNKIKAKVIELCLQSFDPRERTAMPPPDLQRGTLRLSLRSTAAIDTVIAGCPFLWDHLDPVALLHRLTGFDWKEGDRLMPLLPPDHGALRDAMVEVLGKTAARAWAKDYSIALEKGRYKPHHRFSLEDLARLRESLGR
jgi:hypothetical protein